MADTLFVNEWLAKAEEDFKFAVHSLKESAEYLSPICFHFQQAAEKYLKAFIVAHDLEFRKIHDLGELLRVCSEKDQSLAGLKDDCAALTDFYIEARYPAHWPGGLSIEEVCRAHEAAERIRNEIRKRLD
jgi:HEPN domain-containing protein